MFNEGGLKDEGGEIDPVSGNDVPIGSTKEEVRDDIPAMVSEGEFVFPADVVRYIGLNNLMNMRQEAKMGLKTMEAMGQMGNGDEATLPDDMPFGMADIVIVEDSDEPKEMAQGGVIQAQTGTFVTPMFNPSNQDVREYKNAEGQSLFIPFLNGQPVYPIPAGYSSVGQTPTETEVETPAPAEDDGGGGGKKPVVNAFTEAGSWAGSPLDMYIKEANKITTYGNMASGVGAAFNPLIGGFMAVAIKNEKRKILSTIDDRIKQAKTTEEKNELKDIKDRLTNPERKGILSKAINSVFGGIADSLGLSADEKKVAEATYQKVIEQKTDDTDDQTQKEINVITDEMLKGPSVGSIDSLGAGVPTTSDELTTEEQMLAASGVLNADVDSDLPSKLNRMSGQLTEQTFDTDIDRVSSGDKGDTGSLSFIKPVDTTTANVDLRSSIEGIKNPETALDEINKVTSIIEKLEQENKDSVDEINKQTDTILESAPAGVIAAQPNLSAAQATKDKKSAQKRRKQRQKEAMKKAREAAQKRETEVTKAKSISKDVTGAGAPAVSATQSEGPFAKGGLASRRK